MDTNFYLEDLVLDGRLDLSEMYGQEKNKIFPTCLNLIEDESIFKDSIKTNGKRIRFAVNLVDFSKC